jgi:hypothetical protein
MTLLCVNVRLGLSIALKIATNFEVWVTLHYD